MTCGVGNIYFEKNILGRGVKKNVERREISKGGLLGGWVRGRGARIVGNKIGKLGRYEGKKSLSVKNAREKGEGNLNPERGN